MYLVKSGYNKLVTYISMIPMINKENVVLNSCIVVSTVTVLHCIRPSITCIVFASLHHSTCAVPLLLNLSMPIFFIFLFQTFPSINMIQTKGMCYPGESTIVFNFLGSYMLDCLPWLERGATSDSINLWCNSILCACSRYAY